MKLSEMNTVELARALCRIAGPIGELCKDDAFRAVLQKKKSAALGEIAGELIPVLLDKHFAHMVTILSALTGKTEKEIKQQKGMQTVKDLMECMDQDLLDFFTPSTAAEQTESKA